jgi:hypothetical protein
MNDACYSLLAKLLLSIPGDLVPAESSADLDWFLCPNAKAEQERFWSMARKLSVKVES